MQQATKLHKTEANLGKGRANGLWVIYSQRHSKKRKELGKEI
jgi:hypothetical protein